MPVSAEGPLNQTAALSYRLVEFLVFNSAFGRQSLIIPIERQSSSIIIYRSVLVENSYKADADANADADADCLVESSTSTLLEMMVLDDGHLIGSNQCLCLPKAELKTKKLNLTAALLSFG